MNMILAISFPVQGPHVHKVASTLACIRSQKKQNMKAKARTRSL